MRVVLHRLQNTSLLNNVDLARLSWNPGNSHRILHISLLILMWWPAFAMLWYVVVFHVLSHVQLFATPWTAALQASLSSTISWILFKLMSVALVMLSNHLILCRLFLLLPSVFPGIRVFSSESAVHIRWPNYWSFSISPSKIFRVDFL